jgi:hypothetical protein
MVLECVAEILLQYSNKSGVQPVTFGSLLAYESSICVGCWVWCMCVCGCEGQ